MHAYTSTCASNFMVFVGVRWYIKENSKEIQFITHPYNAVKNDAANTNMNCVYFGAIVIYIYFASGVWMTAMKSWWEVISNICAV